MGKKLTIIIAAIIIFALAGVFAVTNAPTKTSEHVPIQATPSVVQANPVIYNGKEGIDALTLLKEQGAVEQNSAGLVTAIAGRKAEDKNREYWAFYVNGQMAAVGPLEYVTKDTDKIEWKIENY